MRFLLATFLAMIMSGCTTTEEVNEQQEASMDKALTPLTRSYRYEVDRSELMEPILAEIQAGQARDQPIRIVADPCSKAELLAVPHLADIIKTHLNAVEPDAVIKPTATTSTPELKTCHDPIRIEGAHAHYFLYNAGSHRSRVLIRGNEGDHPRLPYAEYLLIKRVNVPQADAIRRKVAETDPTVDLEKVQ